MSCDKNVGTGKPVTGKITLIGADILNYSLIQPAGLTANITQKAIFISGKFTVKDKGYNAITDATINESNLVLERIINPDLVILSNLVIHFSQAEIADDILVTISEVDLIGDDIQNYILSLV